MQSFFVNLKRPIKFLLLILLVLGAVAGVFARNHFASAQSDYKKIGIINASEGNYASRRLIVWGTHQDPSIKISTYDNVKRDVKIDVYKISKDDLLSFLTYKVENNERYKANVPDVSRLNKIATLDAKNGDDKTLLPIEGQGFWLMRAYSSDGEQTFSAAVRTSIGTVAKEGNNEIILWTQNILTGKKVGNGAIEIFNLKDKANYLSESPINSDGIAKTSQISNADIGFVSTSEGQTILILNLPNDYYNYQTFSGPRINNKYLLFTDRPLYAPGDKVYFKAIIRNDNDAEYTVPTGLVTVKIYKDYNSTQPLFEKKYAITANGTIAGEYSLDEAAKTGTYQISVDLGAESDREWYLRTVANFNVEHYRKPDYNLEATATRDELLKGENAIFNLSGKYFFGQPVSGGNVHYTVRYLSNQYYTEENLEYYKKYGYSWYYSGNELKSGDVELNAKGEAEISVPTSSLPNGQSSILSLEATYQDESGNPVRASKNILVRGSEYSILAGDYEYSAKVGQAISIPITLLSHSGASVSNVNISVSPIREEWLRDEKLNDQGYYNYHLDQETLPNFSITTNNKGEATLTYTPQKTGSFHFVLRVTDRRGNVHERTIYTWVTKEDMPYYRQNSYGVTLKVQNKGYAPGEIVPVNLSVTEPGKDVLITVERDRVRRFFVTSVPNYATTVYVPTYNSDLPNVFVSASTFLTKGYLFNNSSEEISLLKDNKVINVSITPGAQKYAPGDTAELRIKTTDSVGNPLPAEVAVWAIDKSLYELMSDQRISIMDAFWSKRYNSTNYKNSFEGIVSYGAEKGCFVGDTEVLTPDGLRQIKDIKPGDYVLTRKSEIDSVLVKALVKGVHSITANGYLILNGSIKVTAEHRMWVNNNWKDAGDIQIGDSLLDKNNKEIKIESIEWQAGKVPVYNLTIEGKSTYFADNVYVHNDKGDGGGVRDNFADVAYWNPYVQTDASGNVVVRFVLPDNLTTWLAQGVAVTYDTKVGENATDILVTKPVIVRPILPNILRVGDDITVSTLAHNFTGSSKQFESTLSFDGGNIVGNKSASINLDNNSFAETLWKLQPITPGTAAISATLSSGNAGEKDAVSVKIPIERFGYSDKSSFVGEEAITYDLNRYPDTDISSSKATLYLSASLFGTLPPAINYLLQYPYGCVEQTTSRFVPAVIIKENESLFKDQIGDKNLNDIIKKGVDKLSTLKDNSGGWGWWYGEVNPFITSYVIEYLKRAELSGTTVPSDLYDSTKTRFERELPNITDPTRRIAYISTLSLLSSSLGREEIKNFGTSTPDIIALGLMANIRNGFTNRSTNGYDLLLKIAHQENDRTYWDSGTWMFFGSTEVSTALALRALLEAGAPEDVTTGAARYLASGRKAEYWDNTFATAQTIDALLEFSKKYGKGDDVSYKVWLGDKVINSGTLQGTFDTKTVIVDPNLIAQGTKLRIEPSESGKIYSTFVFDQFRTDKNASPKNNGLNVTRTYRSYWGIGDVVDVYVVVSNIPEGSRYLVVEDELPSGLVPINKSFENERASSYYDPYSYYHWGGNREYTENGIVASFSYIRGNSVNMYYQARIVSRGIFNTPPAQASLMYEPEINGRTGTNVVIITGEKLDSRRLLGDKISIEEKIKTSGGKYLYIIGVLAIAGIIYGYVEYRKRRKNQQPPTQNPV